MNDSLSIAKKINEELKNHPLIIEFKSVEHDFLNSEYLKQLKNEMNFYKKCTMDDETRKKYLNLKKAYDSDPLVCNYLRLKEEVEEFKQEIIDYILKWFMQF